MLNEKLEQAYEKLSFTQILIAPLSVLVVSLVVHTIMAIMFVMQAVGDANGIGVYGLLWIINIMATMLSVIQVSELAPLQLAGIKLDTLELKLKIARKKTIAAIPVYLFSIEFILLMLGSYTDIAYTGQQKLTDILIFTVLFTVIHYIYASYFATVGTDEETVVEESVTLEVYPFYSIDIHEINEWNSNMKLLKKMEETLTVEEIKWINKRQTDLMAVLRMYRGIQLVSTSKLRSDIINSIVELNEVIEGHMRELEEKELKKVERKLERMKGEAYAK